MVAQDGTFAMLLGDDFVDRRESSLNRTTQFRAPARGSNGVPMGVHPSQASPFLGRADSRS